LPLILAGLSFLYQNPHHTHCRSSVPMITEIAQIEYYKSIMSWSDNHKRMLANVE
jgi:hypothetical protein